MLFLYNIVILYKKQQNPPQVCFRSYYVITTVKWVEYITQFSVSFRF